MRTRNMRKTLAMLIALGISWSLSATTPPFKAGEDDEFIQSHWYSGDGVPHNVINKVVRDPHGFLWLATWGGLARFDGRDFVKYTLPSDLTRGRQEIRSIDIEDENTLVLIGGSGKLVRLRDGKFKLHPASIFISDNDGLLSVKVDRSGALWLGTSRQMLMRWDGRQLERIGVESKVSMPYLRYYFVDGADGRTWISYGDFFGWYDAKGLHRYDLNKDHYITIARSHHDGVWIASRERLARLENGVMKVFLSGNDWSIPEAGIQDLYESNDGVLWIAIRGGQLFRLIDGRLDEVPATRIESITEDIDHNVWLGTNGRGLVRLKPKQYVLLNTTAGMPTDVSSSITEDETGALWIANRWGGTVRLKDGKTTYLYPTDNTQFFAANVCADQRGRVWVGATGGLFFATTQAPLDNWVLQPFSQPVPYVQTLLSASNGDLWLSWNYEHIGVIREGKLKQFPSKDGDLPKRVMGIAERKGPDGSEIWIINQSGQLLKLSKEGDRFIAQTLPLDPFPGEFFTLHVDPANRLWVGTSIGLLLWDGANSRLFTSADGLPDDVIYQLSSDSHNRIWACGRQSFFILEVDQLLTARKQPGRRVTATLFGRDDNLDGISGMIGGQPMTWKTRDGRIWFASYRGMVGFDANAASDTSQKLPVYIDGMLVDGKKNVPPSPKHGAPFHIAPNPGQVEFQFSVLNFSAPDRTYARRMLEGFDTEWVEATKERSAVYSRLPPGKYTFRVQATNAGGDLSQAAAATISIEIAAAWWQTTWFTVCVVLVIILVAAWGARLISNRILRQRLRRLELEKKLDRERARIARDLHDELGSRMSRIGFSAESISQEQDAAYQKEMLSELTFQTRGLVEDLHRVVWTINPKHDSWQQLATYISRYAQRLLSDTRIVGTIDGVDTIPDIPVTPDLRHHLVAITKESLNNILKYAKASHVRIAMSVDNGVFHMSICDDGCGFDEKSLVDHDGIGLENMRTRMAEADGKIQITSAPGQGTEIRLSVSLQKFPRK